MQNTICSVLPLHTKNYVFIYIYTGFLQKDVKITHFTGNIVRVWGGEMNGWGTGMQDFLFTVYSFIP